MTAVRKTSGIILALALSALSLSGCNMSDSTKDQGKDAICIAAGGLVNQIRSNDSTARFVAGIVKDNSSGKTKELAEKVIANEGGKEASNDLANYVEKLCK